jgi:hypothetical protein
MVAVPRNTFTRLRRTLTRTLTLSAVSMGEWPTSVDNSLLRELRADQSGLPPEESREVLGAHYVRVRPSVPSPSPSLVCYSPEVAELLGLTPAECQTPGFLRTVSGSPPKSLDCWATAYGASFAGRYGGQRGDGRAISIGQVAGMEVQLKGAGVTPFSRRFDGRAVLRSSVREFLASEAMHHLRVPTTRALCVVATGDQVGKQRRHPPALPPHGSPITLAGAILSPKERLPPLHMTHVPTLTPPPPFTNTPGAPRVVRLGRA